MELSDSGAILPIRASRSKRIWAWIMRRPFWMRFIGMVVLTLLALILVAGAVSWTFAICIPIGYQSFCQLLFANAEPFIFYAGSGNWIQIDTDKLVLYGVLFGVAYLTTLLLLLKFLIGKRRERALEKKTAA